ncbi:membrane hypothetical protein [Azospirillaceae bacterium]
MSRPQRYLTRMVLFLLAVAGVGTLLYPSLENAFRVNVALNGLIVGVLVAGIIYIFRQVIKLFREVRWLRAFRTRSIVAAARAISLVITMSSRLGLGSPEGWL